MIIKQFLLSSFMVGFLLRGVDGSTTSPLQVSGVYPHLAVFNEGGGAPCHSNGNECGIGAVVPWAGKLWMLTYSPHCLKGSSDKLYTVDQNLKLEARPESVGGTPANRMIHRESNQLIMGPYMVDENGKVRVISPEDMPGRMTGTARHLENAKELVYFYDMEGMLYETNVNTLETTKLFHKPVPGWHGKGAYTAQKKLIISNNGERQVFDIKPRELKAGGAPESDEDKGVLATWDGSNWEIIARRQFTDVTGPGGIYGNAQDDDPAWSIGWDKRSVVLMMIDGGRWSTYRLPKSTHTYDHWGGWYTEWPRIREVGGGRMLMDMHGMFYEFPMGFSEGNTRGIKPLANHLRYVPDFCNWNGQLVLATDETSILENPYAGRSQSNLWFGQVADIEEWGAAKGWGGVWLKDAVKAGKASDPMLVNGFEQSVLHLANQANEAVRFRIEADRTGKGQWGVLREVAVLAHGYKFELFPKIDAQWVRLITDVDCTVTAYFHFDGKRKQTTGDEKLFAALADVDGSTEVKHALIRPAKHNKNLQVLAVENDEDTTLGRYLEVDERLSFSAAADDRSSDVGKVLELKREFELDDASVIVEDKSGRYRLPRGSARYDEPFEAGWPRDRRELESERYMFNAHGTFYEVPREGGFAQMRPVATHGKQIFDFCTWRGLLVMSGTRADAKPDGHYFGDDGAGLWFGAIDDLWRLGKPVGAGGVWKDEEVKAGEVSLPFLMTGYDQKKLTLTSDRETTFVVEVDFAHDRWVEYQAIHVGAGETVLHEFPNGYSAHWLRVKSEREARVTGWLEYR